MESQKKSLGTNRMTIPKPTSNLLRVWITATACVTAPIANSFEALISNERSGDLIHINQQGKTTHVVPICNRPRGMTKGATDAEIIIACSDDNMIVIYDRSKRIISSRIESVPGAMNISFHQKTGRVIVTNEGIAQASVYELDLRSTVSGAANRTRTRRRRHNQRR